MDDDPVLPGTEVQYLRSDHVGDEFRILIGRCGDASAGPMPVLYVADPILVFGTTVEIVRLLSLAEHLPPAMLVVGIGYRGSTIRDMHKIRQRDLTPVANRAEDPDPSGGADRFLAFIRDELKPWVHERYPVDGDDSAFYGGSLGGLFATHVLFSEPATFRRYGIGSPAYWWAGEMMFDREAEYAAGHSDLAARVFVSVGERESADGPDMVGQAERMVRQLRARGYPSLEIEFEVLAGEDHATVAPFNVSRSLRSIFGRQL